MDLPRARVALSITIPNRRVLSRVEDGPKGRYAASSQLINNLLREVWIAYNADSLGIKVTRHFRNSRNHIDPPTITSVNKKRVRIEAVDKAEDIGSVCAFRIPGLPNQSQVGILFLTQERQTRPNARSRCDHNNPTEKAHDMDEPIHQHTAFPKMRRLLRNASCRPITCSRDYHRPTFAIRDQGTWQSCASLLEGDWRGR